MLIAPQVVFVELQKTGGTHIHHLLVDLFNGRSAGKHNVPTPEVVDSPIPILGSVRNPWSWYVSLWTFGCAESGEIAQRMGNPKTWVNAKYNGPLPGETPEQDEIYRRASAQRARDFYYADPNNEHAFREWLTVLLSPHFRKMVEPAFSRTAAADVAGAMTYRYFKLFVRGGDDLGTGAYTLDDLKRMDEEHCFANALIRTERLEQDFIEAMAGFGCPLDDSQREMVLSRGKTNTSARPKSTRDYYDDATAQLVATREQFMIRKFGYVSPLEATKQTFSPLVVTMRDKVPYDGDAQRILLAKQLTQDIRGTVGLGLRGGRRLTAGGGKAKTAAVEANATKPGKARKAGRKAIRAAQGASTAELAAGGTGPNARAARRAARLAAKQAKQASGAAVAPKRAGKNAKRELTAEEIIAREARNAENRAKRRVALRKHKAAAG